MPDLKLIDTGMSPGADFTVVRLDSDGVSLAITFVNATPVPITPLIDTSGPAPAPGELLFMDWTLSTRNMDGSKGPNISTSMMNGLETKVRFSDESGKPERIVKATYDINSKTITVTIPISELDDLTAPFQWYAISQWTIRGSASPSDDLLFIDVCPGEGLKKDQTDEEKYRVFPT